MNQQIKNGNDCIHSFAGATSHQLLHYLNINLDNYTDTGSMIYQIWLQMLMDYCQT